jgi:hypothetical protein
MTPELVEALDTARRDGEHDLADVNWFLKIPRPSGLNYPPGLLVVRSDLFRVTAAGLQGRWSSGWPAWSSAAATGRRSHSCLGRWIDA